MLHLLQSSAIHPIGWFASLTIFCVKPNSGAVGPIRAGTW